jgi:DNA repair exonuclease SbcCD ATPase subunit
MERSGNNRRNNKRNWNGRHSQEEGRKKNEKRGGNKNLESRQQGHRGETKLPQHVHEDMQRDLESIKELKQREVTCPICGKSIDDLASALADKRTGEPVHFDCVLEELQKRETLGENQQVTYIGQGRFAVVHFPNMQDTRKFSIVKIIEWEEKDKKFDWRQEIAGMYSQVH